MPSFKKSLPVMLLVGASALATPISIREENVCPHATRFYALTDRYFDPTEC